MSRQERKHLAEEIVRSRNPGISNTELKNLVRAGVYPSRVSSLAVESGIRSQLIDAGGAAFSFTGSATSGVIRKSTDLVIGFSKSIETYND
ncbi:MAG: hypothetical protein COB04_17145 [Gammaproteobacteria bacterium]|nr:MAG: hypothetical protein COB04_17145 [Gammaproteobacteria bacterium]